MNRTRLMMAIVGIGVGLASMSIGAALVLSGAPSVAPTPAPTVPTFGTCPPGHVMIARICVPRK